MKNNLDDEIDSLFRLPLAEFTSARNALAARLKKEGRSNDADRVKLLAKPSISAWAVNQLYWNHRKAYDLLMATGKRLRPAQKLRVAGKVAGMRDSLDARREALVQLSELATELLQDAGSNPSPDTLRRVTTTLEALSAFALLRDGPTPGRLSQDLDPPSFDSLASLMSSASVIEDDESEPVAPSRKSSTTANVRRLEEVRRAKIADAKVSLQDAKRSLSEARARAQSLESTQKKANAEVKEAEKRRREVEQLLEKATDACDDAARRARSVGEELQEVAKTVDDAKRAVETATKDLESLLRGSSV